MEGGGGGVRGRLCVFAYAPLGNQLLLCVKRNLLIRFDLILLNTALRGNILSDKLFNLLKSESYATTQL